MSLASVLVDVVTQGSSNVVVGSSGGVTGGTCDDTDVDSHMSFAGWIASRGVGWTGVTSVLAGGEGGVCSSGVDVLDGTVRQIGELLSINSRVSGSRDATVGSVVRNSDRLNESVSSCIGVFIAVLMLGLLVVAAPVVSTLVYVVTPLFNLTVERVIRLVVSSLGG